MGSLLQNFTGQSWWANILIYLYVGFREELKFV